MNDEKITQGLTFDDVLLVPCHSEVLPRDASPRTTLVKGIDLPVPVLSAAMDTVTEARFALTLARLGGLGVIHKNMSVQRQSDEVRQVKDTGVEADAPDGAAVDGAGRLLVGAAVSVGEYERAGALVEAGVDLLTIDSAHGHSAGVIATVRELKRRFDRPVMAGNVATGEAVDALAEAGADIVKVGVGPGSICTTRIVAGVGVPQLTALSWACAAARRHGVAVVSDGGIRFSGDCVKALAAGATAVMLGRVFSGTDEAPGRKVVIEGRTYKCYRGMGSLEAMTEGGASRYGQEADDGPAKLVPEGVEAVVPSIGPLARVVYQLSGGIKAGMGYLGAPDLATLRTRARFVRQTANGFRESHPHSVAQFSHAPNYEGL